MIELFFRIMLGTLWVLLGDAIFLRYTTSRMRFVARYTGVICSMLMYRQSDGWLFRYFDSEHAFAINYLFDTFIKGENYAKEL